MRASNLERSFEGSKAPVKSLVTKFAFSHPKIGLGNQIFFRNLTFTKLFFGWDQKAFETQNACHM